MKKKILSVLLILCMAVGVCACSKTEGSNATASNDESIVVEDETNVEDSTEESEAESERPEWLSHLYTENNFEYSFWLTNIEWKAAGYGYECRGTLEQEYETEHIYITQYSGDVGSERQKNEIDMSQYQSSEDIFDLLSSNFNDELFKLSWTMTDYTVEVLETKEINGVEMTKFEGMMNVVFDGVSPINYSYPFVAYGIAAKNTPVLLTCIDRSEGSVYHEEWLTKIDEIVKTFKDSEVLIERAWIPEDFALKEANIDFVAPAVHTEANEQCTFMWDFTEDNALEWFHNNYDYHTEKGKVRVYNETGESVFDKRSYSIGNSSENGSSASMEVTTEGYNEQVVSYISFSCRETTLQAAIDGMTKFIAFAGFEDYTEELLHNYSDNWISIETENGLGQYEIRTSYNTNEDNETYGFGLTVYYEDYDYTKKVLGYTPYKMEYWEQDYVLADYIPNSNFDTSGLRAFAESELKFEQENVNSEIISLGYTERYSYTEEQDGTEKELSDFSFSDNRQHPGGWNCYLSISYEEERDSKTLDIMKSQNNRYDRKHSVDDMTEDEIKETNKKSYEWLKNMDTTVDWTLKDVEDNFASNEIDDDIECKYRNENDIYKSFISFNLDYESIDFEFEK